MTLSSTCLGGNAPGLPGPASLPSISAALSRRAALFGAVTVAGVTAGVCTPAQARAATPSTDADLINFARRVETLAAREREVWRRHSEAEDAAFKETPPTPVRREVPGPYVDLGTLSPEERYAKLFAPPAAFWKASAVADDEHRAALAEHARIVEALDKRHGVPRLERQSSQLAKQVTEASETLAAMTATTPSGLAAKARVLMAMAGGDALSRRAELERHEALLESLLEDAARLGTGALS